MAFRKVVLVGHVSGRRDENGSISLGGNHLQRLNHSVRSFVLLACLVLDLLGSLRDFQNKFVTVRMIVQELIKNSCSTHWLSLFLRVLLFSFRIYDIAQFIDSFIYVVVNNFILKKRFFFHFLLGFGKSYRQFIWRLSGPFFQALL